MDKATGDFPFNKQSRVPTTEVSFSGAMHYSGISHMSWSGKGLCKGGSRGQVDNHAPFFKRPCLACVKKMIKILDEKKFDGDTPSLVRRFEKWLQDATFEDRCSHFTEFLRISDFLGKSEEIPLRIKIYEPSWSYHDGKPWTRVISPSGRQDRGILITTHNTTGTTIPPDLVKINGESVIGWGGWRPRGKVFELYPYWLDGGTFHCAVSYHYINEAYKIMGLPLIEDFDDKLKAIRERKKEIYPALNKWCKENIDGFDVHTIQGTYPSSYGPDGWRGEKTIAGKKTYQQKKRKVLGEYQRWLRKFAV